MIGERGVRLVLALAVAWLGACSGGSGGESGDEAAEGGNSPASSGGRHAGVSGGTPLAGSTSSHAGGGTPGGSTSAEGGTPPSGGTSSDAGGGTSGGTSGIPGAIECRSDGDGATTLVFVNRCTEAVTYRGSDIEGGSLEPGAHACVVIGTATEPLSSKRYWGWMGADPGAEHHTLAEFTFNTDFNDFDWYNISHVDAHNLPMEIVPAARPACETLTCAESLLESCPSEGRFTDASGAVVACVSPRRDDGGSPVVLYFESCDEAYAWSADDQNGTDPSPMRACAGEDWDIVFCPGGLP